MSILTTTLLSDLNKVNLSQSPVSVCGKVCQVFADRTNGRTIGTVLRLSVICDVMYCG